MKYFMTICSFTGGYRQTICIQTAVCLSAILCPHRNVAHVVKQHHPIGRTTFVGFSVSIFPEDEGKLVLLSAVFVAFHFVSY